MPDPEHGDQQADEEPEGRPEAEHEGAAQSSVDSGLTDLRSRLDQLRHSVELLSSQGQWPEQEDVAPPSSGLEYGYGPAGDDPGYGYGPDAGQAPDPDLPGPPPPPHPADPPYANPSGGPAGEPYYEEPYEAYPEAYRPPSPPPAGPWGQPPKPPLTYPAPPVATNGHTTDPAEISDRTATVALVDVGPFDDLIELRHFEDDLAALPAVRDVRVRRFGAGRASIEVGMASPYALARELYRLERPMEVGTGPEGEVVIALFEPTLPDAEAKTGAAPPPADLTYPRTPAGAPLMFSTVINVVAAMALLIALSLFFVGFVLAPLIVLAVGYIVFYFLAPD